MYRPWPMFPERPIDLIVPFREDSASDFVARLIAARLSQTWGQDIMVHNHPRAGAPPAGRHGGARPGRSNT